MTRPELEGVSCDTRSDLDKAMFRAYMLGMRVFREEIEPEQALTQLNAMISAIRLATPSPVGGGVEERKTEVMLRWLLARTYSGANLYCDDGEMSDSSAHPAIDFLRDEWEVIESKMQQRAAALRTQPKTGGDVECSMCSRWQALAEAAQLGQAVAERRRGVLDEYVKKMDGIIEEVGGVTASCINPYEDLKRALQGQKWRAETAEAALLAKSEAYDALVAEIAKAPVGVVVGVNFEQWDRPAWSVMDDRDEVPLTLGGARVRLLVQEGGDDA